MTCRSSASLDSLAAPTASRSWRRSVAFPSKVPAIPEKADLQPPGPFDRRDSLWCLLDEAVDAIEDPVPGVDAGASYPSDLTTPTGGRRSGVIRLPSNDTLKPSGAGLMH